jgi:hypothetical protein
MTIDIPMIAAPIAAANTISGTAKNNPSRFRLHNITDVTIIAGKMKTRSSTWIGLTGRPTSFTSRGVAPDASAARCH